MQTISVIGLGKLGLPMAVYFAHRGLNVIGVDVNPKIIKAVNEKRCPLSEPGVPEIMKTLSDNLIAIDDYEYAINNSKISFIFTPTPTDGNGGYSTEYVEAAGMKIAENLRKKDDFHLIVLRSTVLPGASDYLKELIEKNSGKKCGVNFGLCYNPEFLALGNVLRALSHPDFILIGESDAHSGELLSNFYKEICENNPDFIRTNFQNAELAKILVNTYITLKISFANTVAEICERVTNADSDVVSKILGMDTRIGRKFLSGGLAYGGTCFPRDNRALAFFVNSIGLSDKIAKVTDEINNYQKKRVVTFIKNKKGDIKDKKIGILGLTFKPDTDVIVESASIEIIKDLLIEGGIISVYDPAGLENARKVLGNRVKYAKSVEGCIKGTELCVLATPWNEFKTLKPDDFIKNMEKPVLIDCWRIFNRPEFRESLEYFAIGLYSI